MIHATRKSMTTRIAMAGVPQVLLASGCATTVESTPAAAKALESGAPLTSSVTGFLGPDAAKLALGPEGGAALAWINPDAQWGSCTNIQLMPVEFWAAADSTVSTSDQQVLTGYFYNALQTNLAKSFTLVDQPGPGVMTLRVALMDATTATPGLPSISVLVPLARILNGVQSLATGSYAFVGSAEAEMKLTDSVNAACCWQKQLTSVPAEWGLKAQLRSNGVTRRMRWITGHRRFRTAYCNSREDRQRRASVIDVLNAKLEVNGRHSPERSVTLQRTTSHREVSACPMAS